MKRAERRAWQAARSLADLGELTARWLDGELKETPGHLGPPDPETTELVPTLAALEHRSRDGSQPSRKTQTR